MIEVIKEGKPRSHQRLATCPLCSSEMKCDTTDLDVGYGYVVSLKCPICGGLIPQSFIRVVDEDV
jgi:C4-type Zn-finger protein